MSINANEKNELTVGDIGEVELIKRILPMLRQPEGRIVLGAGDDAAVLAPLDGKPVITVDTMSQGVHFDLAYTSPADLGHRLFAANLSDIAAMGAKPVAAVISLALPGDTPVSFVEGLYDGFRELSERFDVAVVGGDIVGSGDGITATLTLIGEAGENLLTRSGCRTGDLLLLTGEIGLSEAGLQNLTGNVELPGELGAAADKHHLRPAPRLGIGRILTDNGLATACIDTSDSLAISLHHLSEMSRVGFVVDADALPVSAALIDAERQLAEDGRHPDYNPTGYALYAGEDFELLFTSPPENVDRIIKLVNETDISISVIGETVVPERGITLLRDGRETAINAHGFAHF
jgi:thiamine-monophosphate kinase